MMVVNRVMITLHAHAGMPKERDREVTATTNSRQLLILAVKTLR